MDIVAELVVSVTNNGRDSNRGNIHSYTTKVHEKGSAIEEITIWVVAWSPIIRHSSGPPDGSEHDNTLHSEAELFRYSDVVEKVVEKSPASSKNNGTSLSDKEKSKITGTTGLNVDSR